MKRSIVSIALLALIVLFWTRAFAQGKPTAFDEALAAAKRESKPLVVELGATWCGPCQALAADIKKPAGKAALESVHFVSYDVDEEPGDDVMQQLGVRSFPTLVAFDTAGKEIARKGGYGGLSALAMWIREVPDRALSIDDVIARAKASPREPAMQLAAGKRLFEAGRAPEARTFLGRAARGVGPSAATAHWMLARLDLTGRRVTDGAKAADAFVRRHPASDEADMAIRFLAAMPKPPLAVLDRALNARAGALRDDIDRLNDLAYVALRAGAYDAALTIAQRLEQLGGGKAMYLDTVAEVHHMRGDRDRAVAIEEKAVALPGGDRLRDNLDRFRAGGRDPGRDMLAVRAPALDLEPPRKDQAATRPPSPPAWVKAQKSIQKRITEECAKVAGDSLNYYAYVVTGPKPRAHKIVPRPGTPAPLAVSAEKIIRETELPDGVTFEVYASMETAALKAAIENATKEAKAACAGLTVPPAVQLVLVGSAGKRPTVTIGTPGVSTDVASRIERAFAGIILPVAVLRSLTVAFVDE